MPGHVHKRSHLTKGDKESVLYYAVVELPRVNGKRRSDWGKGFRRKKDAENALVEKLSKVNAGEVIARSDLTVADCLHRWLASVVGSVKPTTLDSYQRSIDQYLEPQVGSVKLQQLRPANVQQLSERLLANGGRRKSQHPVDPHPERPLAPKTVRNHLNVLGAALKYAVGMGWIASDPMSAVKKPSARRSKQMKVWNADEVAAYLQATSDHDLSTLFHLALFTGLRRGELLGLRWEDIDFTSSRLAVRQTLVLVGGRPQFGTPKSHEARTVDLDAETVDLLRRWRIAQRCFLEGVPPSRDLVFTDAGGSPLRPDTVSYWFRKAVERSPIERRISFHEMRHTHASLLLKAGEPVHVVSQRLGHADVGFTLRVYSHVLPGMQAEAAESFSSLIRAENELRANEANQG